MLGFVIKVLIKLKFKRYQPFHIYVLIIRCLNLTSKTEKMFTIKKYIVNIYQPTQHVVLLRTFPLKAVIIIYVYKTQHNTTYL